MYGISRIDDDIYRTHAWRVSLRRHGKSLVKNFADKKLGGKGKALTEAKRYRDELLEQYPPMSRKEFASIKRRNNNTGITGVYRYAKKYMLKDGREKESWYWEAHWPTAPGESQCINFSVNEYGEAVAKQLAIRARKEGLNKLKGVFWASARGKVASEEATTTKTAASAQRKATPSKKAAAKKAPVKKVTAKKTAEKKTQAKKAAVKKPSAKKAAASAKTPSTKRAPAKKSSTKKASTPKATAKKSTAKKVSAQKKRPPSKR